MAKQFVVTNRDGSTKTLHHTAKASKYASINNMTIPQIQAAKKIIHKKLQSGEIDKNPLLKNKLTDVANQYEQTEREINKYYQKYATDPRVKNLIEGKKNSLTIAKINKKAYPTKMKGKQNGLRYRKRDMLMDALSSKFALGIGITAVGLGVAGQITSAVFGKSLMQLLGELLKMMWANNPAALVAIGAGAALIAANRLIPAIRNKVHNVQNKKLQLNQVQNELTGESEKEIDQFDAELLHENAFNGQNENGKKNKDVLINSIYNNPVNVLEGLGIQVPGGYPTVIKTDEEVMSVIAGIKAADNLSPTQKTNLIEVVKESAKKAKEAEKKANSTEVKEDEKEGTKKPAVTAVSTELSKLICDITVSKGVLPSTKEELLSSIQELYPDLDSKEAEKIAQQIAQQLANSKEHKTTAIEMTAGTERGK